MNARRIPMGTVRRLRAEGKTHREISEVVGVSEKAISYRLGNRSNQRKSAVKEKLTNLGPCKYGRKVYDKQGKLRTVVREARFGVWFVEGEGPCCPDPISVMDLSLFPPVPEDDCFISDRLAGFTKSRDASTPLAEPTEDDLNHLDDAGRAEIIRAYRARREQLIEHALEIASRPETTTVKSRRSTARDGADPDTNLKATQEQRRALRKEAAAERTGKPFTLLIQHDKRQRNTGRNVLHGKHPNRLPGEFACPFCQSQDTWSRGISRGGKRRRACKAEGCGKSFTVEERVDKGAAR